MVTLQEFLTMTKGIEYIIAVLFLVGYVAYWGMIKERPFAHMTDTVRDDLEYLRSRGYWTTVKTIGKLVGAPFVGLFYLVGLPFIFLFSLVYFTGKMLFGAGKSES